MCSNCSCGVGCLLVAVCARVCSNCSCGVGCLLVAVCAWFLHHRGHTLPRSMQLLPFELMAGNVLAMACPCVAYRANFAGCYILFYFIGGPNATNATHARGCRFLKKAHERELQCHGITGGPLRTCISSSSPPSLLYVIFSTLASAALCAPCAAEKTHSSLIT